MGEENKIRDAADAIKGIVQAVPVYQDAVQPAAKEIGKALQTVTKTVHIALAPISVMVWGFERISEYLEAALAEKLKYVPPERIIQPDPSVAGPTIEALRFAANEPSLREIYANLLATSMDAETAQNAHPAFVEIIRQMTADEAKIMSLLADEPAVCVSEIFINDSPHVLTHGQGRPTNVSKYAYLAEKSACLFPSLIPSYLDNLRRLGLVNQEHEGWHKVWLRTDGRLDDYLEDIQSISPIQIQESNSIVARVIRFHFAELIDGRKDSPLSFSVFANHVTLTAFGKQFVDACVFEGCRTK